MGKKDEIEYLARIGAAGRKHAADKPYSDARPWALLEGLSGVLRFLPRPPALIGDFGCGTGWTTVFLARMGYDLVGVDISKDMIQAAKGQTEKSKVESKIVWCECDYESFSYEVDFDAVVFFDSLHHAEDERQALVCAYDVLKKGGILVTHEPGSGHASTETSKRAAQNFGVTEKDIPACHIIRMAEEIGFALEQVVPLPEATLNRSFRQTRMPWANRLLGSAFMQAAAAFMLWIRKEKAGSIVVMRKL